SNFIPSSTLNGIEWGLNYLGRTDDEELESRLVGLDFVAKKRDGKFIGEILQSEIWMRFQTPFEEDLSKQAGAYVFYDKYIGSNSHAGFRVDTLKDLTRTNTTTDKLENNIAWEFSPQFTYTSSEFAKFRFTATRELTIVEGSVESQNTRITAQSIFIIGSHPAHDF
ncbi:hypothetical protein N9W79_02165, partial [bacterium]|nr:hypothetical protein [bacterium]